MDVCEAIYGDSFSDVLVGARQPEPRVGARTDTTVEQYISICRLRRIYLTDRWLLMGARIYVRIFATYQYNSNTYLSGFHFQSVCSPVCIIKHETQ